MILDYPKLHDNELYFAYILRYYRYRGESNIDRHFQYFLQTSTYPTSVVFMSSLNKSLEDICLEPKEYVESHSTIPYYRIFCEKELYENLKVEKIVDKAFYMRRFLQKQNTGIATENSELKYCPICHSDRKDYSDIQIYHQIPEVHVCAEHHCYLKSLSINSRRRLRAPENWDVSFEECTDAWLNGIAEDVKYIFDTKPNIFVDSFQDAFWKWFEECEIKISFKDWEKWVLESVMKLPDVYRQYFKTFDFRKHLTAENSANVPGIEYLVLVRMMFGGFREFVEDIISSKK